MARLSTVDIGFQGQLDRLETWHDARASIPYGIFGVFTKAFCPVSKCNFGRITIHLGSTLKKLPSFETFNVEVPFELNRFCKLETLERNETILKTITEVLESHAEEIGFATNSATEAAQVVRDHGYRWRGFIGLGKCYSPDRSRHAKLWLDFGDEATLTLKIIEGNHTVQSIVVFEREITHNYWFDSICETYNRIEWRNNNELKIFQKNERDYWSFDVDESRLEFHFPRAERGDAQGAFDLGKLYLTGTIVPRDISLAMHWIKISASKGYKHAIRFLAKHDADALN